VTALHLLPSIVDRADENEDRIEGCALLLTGVCALLLPAGRLRKLKAERARLRKLHKNMTTTDLNASIQADLELDADGSFWKQVQEWRRQRVAAINREIQRLSSLIGDMDKSAATAAGTATVQDEAQHNQQEAHKESNPEADAAATVSGCSGVSDVEAAGGEEMERGRCEAPVDLVAAVESK